MIIYTLIFHKAIDKFDLLIYISYTLSIYKRFIFMIKSLYFINFILTHYNSNGN